MTQNSINNATSSLDVQNLHLEGNTLSSTDTNGNVIVSPEGTGEVSILAAPIIPTTDRGDSLGSTTNAWDNVYCDGLTFDDGVNTMDTFVENTFFTPVLEFGGATTGITYSLQAGRFLQIGKLVFVSLNLILTSKGSASGNATISGLPVVIFNSAPGWARWSGINLTASYTAVVPTFGGGTSIDLEEQGDNVAFVFLTDASFSNASQLALGGIYFSP